MPEGSEAQMARTPGRDQTAAVERLVRIVAVLSAAGAEGVPVDDLVAVGAYGAEAIEDQRTQLQRDVRELGRLGWSIENTASQGSHGRYVLHTVDSRLTVQLTPVQQAALQRAALTVDRADLAASLGPRVDVAAAPSLRVQKEPESPHLSTVLQGVRESRLVRFTYKGTPRTVHGATVWPGDGRWYLTGREEGADTTKHFVIARMIDVRLGAAGSATPPPGPVRPAMDPLTWRVDPPVRARLECPADHAVDVERLMGTPITTDRHPTSTALTYEVTHREAFLDRVFELGERVRLVSPPELVDQMVRRLREVANA